MKAGKVTACKVCDSPTAKSYHFGVKSCKACAAFFRRTIALNVQYQCRRSLACPIDHDKRYMCKLCRYNKCIEIGMMPELVESKGKISERKNRSPLPETPQSHSSIELPSCGKAFPNISIEEVIAHYVKLESQLVDRRRITYNTSKIQDIIYNQKDCPFELKDLKLFDWRTYNGCEQFEFAAVYDYARCFLQYDELNKVDQDNLYRLSCAVDVLMGMAYYTVKEGVRHNVLINTNATYYPMDPLPPTGEEPQMAGHFASEDEHQRYKLLIGPYSHYWSTLILPLDKLDISLAEFALLKALVCWHICYYKFLTPDQEICTVQRNLIMKALLKLAEDRSDGCGVIRMGELLLYINSVFEHIYNLLESLYMAKVFNIVPLGDFVCDMLVLGR